MGQCRKYFQLKIQAGTDSFYQVRRESNRCRTLAQILNFFPPKTTVADAFLNNNMSKDLKTLGYGTKAAHPGVNNSNLEKQKGIYSPVTVLSHAVSG